MPDQNPATPPGQPGQAQGNSGPGAAMDGYTKEAHSFMNREVQAAQEAQRAAEAKAEELQRQLDEASWFQEQMTGMADSEYAPYLQAYMTGNPPAQSGQPTPPPAQNGPPQQTGQAMPKHADGTPVTHEEVFQMFRQFGQNLETTYGGHIAKLNNLTFNREASALIEKYGPELVSKHKEGVRQILAQNPNLGIEKAFLLSAVEDVQAQAMAKGREMGRRDATFMTAEPSGGPSVIKPEVDPRIAEGQKLMTTGNPADKDRGLRMIVQAKAEKLAQEGG